MQSQLAVVLHLSLLGSVLAGAVFAEGGMIPEAWLVCQLLIGLLAVTWAFSGRGSGFSPDWTQRFSVALICLPLYAAFQAVPLPLTLVQALSPVRAELQRSVSLLVDQAPSWTPLSVVPSASISFALRLAAYAVVYWIVCGLARHLGRFRFAAIAPVVVVAAIESAVAVAQQFSGEAARGSYFNRNHLAGLLEMSLPFAVVAAVTMGRDTARRSGTFSIVCAAGGAAVLILSGILATRSRAALLAVSASLLVLGAGAVASLVRLRRKWLLAALPPALLAAGLLYLTPESLVRRYGALAGRENLLREGRVLLWSETLDLIAAYPLVGCGFGGYEAAFLRYKQSEPMVTDTHAHNDYLELLAEAGVIGFALCVALVVPVTVAALRKSQQPGHAETSLALACVGSLTAILVHSFVDFNLRIPANGMVFCWVLGVCRAVSAREAA